MMKKEIATTIKSIRKNKSISGPELVALERYCGDRFWKALQAVTNDLVKKYIFEPSGREAWIVVGKTRDYRVLSDIYCDCEDFYINVIVKRSANLCYHILAKVLAEALSIFSEIRVDDMMYDTLRVEWETLPAARSTRKSEKRSIE
jgi:predicted nucleic acid-binding Zn finger protein